MATVTVVVPPGKESDLSSLIDLNQGITSEPFITESRINVTFTSGENLRQFKRDVEESNFRNNSGIKILKVVDTEI